MKPMRYEDVAEYTGFSQYTIREAKNTGELAYIQPGHRRVFFLREDVDEWLQRKRRPARSIR